MIKDYLKVPTLKYFSPKKRDPTHIFFSFYPKPKNKKNKKKKKIDVFIIKMIMNHILEMMHYLKFHLLLIGTTHE